MATMRASKVQIPTTILTDGPPVYTLTLSLKEAGALKSICGNIVGDCYRSPRKYTDTLWDVLRRHTGDTVVFDGQFDGYIRFENWETKPETDRNEPAVKAERVSDKIVLTLHENAAKTIAVLTGRMPAYSSSMAGTVSEHLHTIFMALAMSGFGTYYADRVDISDFYVLMKDVKMKPREPIVKKPEVTKPVIPLPLNWPPKIGDTWAAGKITWFASASRDGKIKLHSPYERSIYFEPQRVLDAWPYELKLVYRA